MELDNKDEGNGGAVTKYAKTNKDKLETLWQS